MKQTKSIGRTTFNVFLAAVDVLAAGYPKAMVEMACNRKRCCTTVLIVAFSCLGLLPPALAAPGSWIQMADIPAPTSTPASCVVDDIFYVIGGHYQLKPTSAVFAYDPQTNSWTRKADLPVERMFSGGAAADGIIYVIGGRNKSGEDLRPVAAYDPKTDTWVNKANITTGRNTPAVCAVDGIIYAIGGFTATSRVLATVEAYDPKTDQWTRKSNVPKPMYFATASMVDGLIYVFDNAETYAYDPKTDRWTAKAHFSPYSFALMSAVVDGTIYLFGGLSDDSFMSGRDFALAYDSAQNRFTPRRKIPRKRAGSGCGVIDGKIYLAGGVDKEPIVNTNAVYWKVLDVFDPQDGVTAQISGLIVESTNRVRLAWQGELGRLYGIQSKVSLDQYAWHRLPLSTGTNSVLCTNPLMEATCTVPSPDTNRFFQVFEVP